MDSPECIKGRSDSRAKEKRDDPFVEKIGDAIRRFDCCHPSLSTSSI